MVARRSFKPDYTAAVRMLTPSRQSMKYIAQGSNKPGLIARWSVRVSFAADIVFSAPSTTRTRCRSGDSRLTKFGILHSKYSSPRSGPYKALIADFA
jgi:hypothetical protein